MDENTGQRSGGREGQVLGLIAHSERVGDMRELRIKELQRMRGTSRGTCG